MIALQGFRCDKSGGGRVIIDPTSTVSVAEQIWKQGDLVWMWLNQTLAFTSYLLDQFKCTSKTSFAIELSLEMVLKNY